jgi:hypothetical protein
LGFRNWDLFGSIGILSFGFNKMNILFITNHLNTGGVTTYCLTLAKGLQKRGHRVYIASSGGQRLPEFLDN